MTLQDFWDEKLPPTWTDMDRREEEYGARVAQLREALRVMLPWAAIEIRPTDPNTAPELVQDWKAAKAALYYDTADDWLVQHNAEIKAQERERCANKCNEVAEKLMTSAERSANHGAFVHAAAHTHKALGAEECATAIREADDD